MPTKQMSHSKCERKRVILLEGQTHHISELSPAYFKPTWSFLEVTGDAGSRHRKIAQMEP